MPDYSRRGLFGLTHSMIVERHVQPSTQPLMFSGEIQARATMTNQNQLARAMRFFRVDERRTLHRLSPREFSTQRHRSWFIQEVRFFAWAGLPSPGLVI
jgi:hypothetical protein